MRPRPSLGERGIRIELRWAIAREWASRSMPATRSLRLCCVGCWKLARRLQLRLRSASVFWGRARVPLVCLVVLRVWVGVGVWVGVWVGFLARVGVGGLWGWG